MVQKTGSITHGGHPLFRDQIAVYLCDDFAFYRGLFTELVKWAVASPNGNVEGSSPDRTLGMAYYGSFTLRWALGIGKGTRWCGTTVERLPDGQGVRVRVRNGLPWTQPVVRFGTGELGLGADAPAMLLRIKEPTWRRLAELEAVKEKDALRINVGKAMFVLRSPEGTEGAGCCIEGLQLIRERERGAPITGVGISVPYKEIPKGTTLRNVKIHGQKVGVHIKFAWQVYFSDCIFRDNETGMIIQCHGNNIGIVNCIFRRNHHHGLVIGPDRGQTASNAQHISGSIFEANKGYGILLLTSGQTMITGNYFEANGNDLGAMSSWETTVDTNFFWGSYGHGWEITPYSDCAHIVVGKAGNLQLRNNHYGPITSWFRRKKGTTQWEYAPRAKGPQGVKEQKPRPPEKEPGYEYQESSCPILITGAVWGDDNVFDALPRVHHKASILQTRLAKDSGLQYYRYDTDTNEFVVRSLLEDVSEE